VTEGVSSPSGASNIAANESARARQLRRRIITVGVLALVALAVLPSYDIWRSYGRTLDENNRELANLAIALAGKADSSLRSVDLLLRDTAGWYATAGAVGPAAINETLARRAARIPSVRLAIADAQGVVVFRSPGTMPTIENVSDRPFFIDQREHGPGGVDWNEALITQRARHPAVLLSRRLDNPGGSFRGIIFAVVELDHFQSLYHEIKLDQGSAIVLLRDDGMLLMREPPLPLDAAGRTFPELARPDASGRGVHSGLDNRQQLIGTSPASHFPLVVAVTRDKAAALDDWRQLAFRVLITGSVLVALGVFAISNLLRQVRRIEVSEDALRASEERYALVMQGANEGHWDWNLTGGPSFISPRNKELYGKSPTTPVTSFAQWRSLLEIHPDDLPTVDKAIETHLAGGTDRYEIEYRVRHPDGQWHWLQLRGRCLRDASGRPLRFIGTSSDITQRKNAEAEKERLERQLRHAQKLEAMGTLAGGIAHDFNNILGAIIGYGELAQAKAAPGSAEREYLDNVMHAGERAKRLVEQILTFSRSGVAERAAVDVQAVVAETLELFAASLRPDIRLEKILGAAGAAILGDPTQVHQVVMNLCTNAMHAMPDGGVLEVVLDREHHEAQWHLSLGTLAPGDYLRLRVSDTGTGIPASVVERMFDPFFTTKSVGQGTGLGLSLVHAIVSDLDGAIDVTTADRQGTAFTIWLPIRAEAAQSPRAAARDVPSGSGQTIMVVDDEPALVALAEETLADLGYEPVGFKSSVAALTAFRTAPQRFDAVITDETMPDLTGIELAEDVRRLRPDIPIVLMSGYAGTQLIKRATTLGVTEILRKPLVRREIAEGLERALAR
jgi:PAS domain S-box-containing protein